MSFKGQPLRQGRLGGIADEAFDVSDRFWRMRCQAPRDLHCAIKSLAAHRFVHQALPFGFARIERLAHKDVHQRGWHSDSAWQPLSAASAGNEPKLCLRQSDQIVAILSDAKI